MQDTNFEESQLELLFNSRYSLENILKKELLISNKNHILNSTILSPLPQSKLNFSNQRKGYVLEFMKMNLESFDMYLSEFISSNLSRDYNLSEDSIAQKLCVIYGMQQGVVVVCEDDFLNDYYIILPTICASDPHTLFMLEESPL
ncbi:MAG: hypothetical protein LAT82_02245 [Nanoarchaeota archaeon]|nr:hypothetical protein [Nanoarchaeota archaeon]